MDILVSIVRCLGIICVAIVSINALAGNKINIRTKASPNKIEFELSEDKKETETTKEKTKKE